MDVRVSQFLVLVLPLLPQSVLALPQWGGQPSEPVYEKGPVITTNFPDPCIVEYEGMWYSFATDTSNNGIVTNIQIAQSPDFNTWSLILNPDGSQRDALSTAPAWVNMTTLNTWAPDINRFDDGSFIMYYSATALQDFTKHCVGAATSATILGPYSPLSTPLACNLVIGGAVDAAGFKDWQAKGSGWGTGNGRADDVGWEDWHKGNHGWGSNNPWVSDPSKSVSGLARLRFFPITTNEDRQK